MWCALNALSVLRAELGSLDRIERVLTVLGFVACVPGFEKQPAVIDGSSQLLFASSVTPVGTRAPRSVSPPCLAVVRSRSRSRSR